MSKKEQLELLDCLNSAMVLVSKYQKLIEPFLDGYFRGLQPLDIAELAKKSIRLTAENRRLEEAIEEIEAATKINCEEICGRTFENCNDTSCFSVNILDIIQKVKQVKN